MESLELEKQPSPYDLTDEQEKKEIVRRYRALLRALKPKLKTGDKELVRRAFELSVEAHKTMRRKTGEPYIFHPLAVAMICVEEIGLGVRSTICALLHDTVEDTDLTLEEIQLEFGSEMAKIIDGLTKIATVVDNNTTQQVENFKKEVVNGRWDIVLDTIKDLEIDLKEPKVISFNIGGKEMIKKSKTKKSG